MALLYLKFLEKTLDIIGYWIKNILFSLTYFFIFCPVALILRISKKISTGGYLERNKDFQASDFEKMW